MARKKRWVDRRCCDWDTFLCSVMASAARLKFPVLLINRCEARRYWRHYGCTGHEVVLMQHCREVNAALYNGYGEPPGRGKRPDDGGNGGSGGTPVKPSGRNPNRPLLLV